MPSRRSLAVALLAATVFALPASAGAASTAGHWPRNLTRPRVSGTTTVGHTLKATRGTWSRRAARTPSGYSYAWLSCRASGAHCRIIKGAHARRYHLRARDAGRRLRVRVTARRRAGGRTLRTSARSRATKAIRAAGLPAPGGPPAPGGSPGPQGAPGLHVSGNQLLDGNGNAVRLHGVNLSGLEYTCIHGDGIFDGPSDDASVQGIRSWNSNVVHLGLNEDCVLGINGAPAAYSRANYLNAIVAYVNRLHAHDMYAEISLMWAAPGSQQALDHPPILDADHSPAAWKAIADAFKGDANTFFGLQSEPHDISWACWKNGGGSCSVGYTALGMQGALDAIRSTGATNVVTASGIDWSNNLTQWLQYRPSDPQGQLMAEAHVYGGNSCDTAACLESTMAPVAAQVPLVFGETGEDVNGGSCTSDSHISAFLTWADAHGVGYEAWQWNPWGTCLDLTTDAWDGTVADNAHARYIHAHYANLP